MVSQNAAFAYDTARATIVLLMCNA